MILKYCPGSTIIEWFKNPNKTHKNRSIGWKALVESYPLVGNWIASRIGNGTQVRLGEDLWVGAEENFILSESIISQLRAQRIIVLADAQA